MVRNRRDERSALRAVTPPATTIAMSSSPAARMRPVLGIVAVRRAFLGGVFRLGLGGGFGGGLGASSV